MNGQGRWARPTKIGAARTVLLSAMLALMGGPWSTALAARFDANYYGIEGPTPGYGGLPRKNVDNFGRAMLVGDFNDDGEEDLLVGAPYYDDEVIPEGEDAHVYGGVFVIWGPLDQDSEMELALLGNSGEGEACEVGGTNGVLLGNELGMSLAVVDGFLSGHSELVVVGAPGQTLCSPRFEETGRVYLYEYAGLGIGFEQVAELINEDWEFQRFGWRVAAIGDISGGSNQDIVVGTQAGDPSTADRKVFIFEGGGSSTSIAPSITVTYASPPSDSRFGVGVYGGLYNSDTYADVIISDTTADYGANPNAGRLYVYLGSASPGSAWTQAGPSLSVFGMVAGGQLGSEVALADINGDSVTDLVVTVPGQDELLIFAGPLSATTSLFADNPTSKITGVTNLIQGNDAHGNTLRADRDVTGDTVNDVLLGQHSGSVSNDFGDALILRGGSYLTNTSSHTLSSLLAADYAIKLDQPEHMEGRDQFGYALVGLSSPDPSQLTGRIAVGAPWLQLPGSGIWQEPGQVTLYDLNLKRVAYRERGEDAWEEGLNFTGTPVAALSFDYRASTQWQNVFVSRSERGLLYRAENIQPTSGLAHFEDRSFAGVGFAALADVPQSDLRGGAASDFDIDGDVDLLVTAPSGTSADTGMRLYQYDLGNDWYVDVADAVMIRGTGQSLKDNFQNYRAASWADFDQDGQIDPLLTGTATPPVLLQSHYTEDGDFEDVSTALGIELVGDPGMTCYAHAWGDYDGDGDLDLYLGQETQASTASGPLSRLYRNNVADGEGLGEILVDLVGANPTTDYNQLSGDRSAAWTDVDGDAILDLVVAKSATFSGFAYLRGQGDGTFDHGKLPSDNAALVVAPMDYDFDGRINLLSMPEAISDDMKVLRHVGVDADGLVFANDASDAALGVAGGSPFILGDDFAGASQRDGDIDLILGRNVSAADDPDLVDRLLQALTLDADEAVSQFMGVDAPPAKYWIGIVPRGNGGSNTSGIGATVRCSYMDGGEQITQIRQVDGGSLRMSQGAPVLRFGLSQYSGTVQVEIQWQDGRVDTYGALATNQVHELWQSQLTTGQLLLPAVSIDLYENTRVVTFTWETLGATRRQNSGVQLSISSGACPVGVMGDGDDFAGPAQYKMEPVPHAGSVHKYKHTLIWTTSCNNNCVFRWRPVMGFLSASGEVDVRGTWAYVGSFMCIGM